MSLSRHFQQQLEGLPTVLSTRQSVVAYSGGVDSHVLLHLCKSAGLSMRAVHVHHGLQDEADQWSMHCQSVCEQLGIDYTCLHVDAQPKEGESPEDAARNARYRALGDNLEPDEVLLTAHHQEDQAETLLLQLLRSAGPAGLASMPVEKKFACSFQVRPLLDFSKQQILQYAEENNLQWIEDPSNADINYDRNYLRNEVMPVLTSNWPGVTPALCQASALQQDALEIIEAMAAIDLAAVTAQNTDTLSVSALRRLPQARLYNVLRHWINTAGMDKPRRNILQEIVNNVLPAAEDAIPLVFWGSTEVRRYQDCLYILPTQQNHEIHQIYSWDGEQPLYLDDLNMELKLVQSAGKGLQQVAVRHGLSVRFRQGGEYIRPQGRHHKQSLKKLMQDAGIPPWQRNRIPLLYIHNELACVCGYWIAEGFAVKPDQQGWNPVCQPIGKH